jgi:hypothetical protein
VRVGLVSRYFREHVAGTSSLFAALVWRLPRDVFTVVAFGFPTPADEWAQQVRVRAPGPTSSTKA